MEYTFVVLATLAGFTVGAFFAFLNIPTPAPPKLAGVMGIFGIWLGYRVVQHLDLGIDVLDAVGL